MSTLVIYDAYVKVVSDFTYDESLKFVSFFRTLNIGINSHLFLVVVLEIDTVVSKQYLRYPTDSLK